jgi:hypothetical protein
MTFSSPTEKRPMQGLCLIIRKFKKLMLKASAEEQAALKFEAIILFLT